MLLHTLIPSREVTDGTSWLKYTFELCGTRFPQCTNWTQSTHACALLFTENGTILTPVADLLRCNKFGKKAVGSNPQQSAPTIYSPEKAYGSVKLTFSYFPSSPSSQAWARTRMLDTSSHPTWEAALLATLHSAHEGVQRNGLRYIQWGRAFDIILPGQ